MTATLPHPSFDDPVSTREPTSDQEVDEEVARDPNENRQPSSTPWYLQIDTSQRSMLERQQIPELPPDPPPHLKAMLEHMSTNIGLDDLMIFDLREIDPPPALGANLLMMLGTARSEKHLHVSADRFCRWLKTTLNLKPYADGLLGRGQLKLRLRRKARRAKLLSNVGASEKANPDDGIRTGWICVNVGTIDDRRNHVESYAEQNGFIGFGSDSIGTKLVIQMLTQEKRDELNLEDLWGKMLRRQERK
ncbi:ATPase synthesis protein 25 mitochondrial [Puttea exsequens]|nr:ATPase synthesis protein 25 mitochondrial [Puttea exsequens]